MISNPLPIAFAGLLLASAAALGADPVLPVISKVSGQAATVSFADGRVATLMLSRNAAGLVPYPFEVTENTCTGVRGVQCRFELPFRLDRMAVKWSVHPDASQVGKTLETREPRSTFDFYPLTSDDFILNQSDRLQRPKLAASLPADAIVCDDFSWLPGGGRGAPPAIRVVRWNTEAMTTNSETETMENRASAGGMGISLEPRSPQALSIGRIEHYTGGTPNLFIGDVVALILREPRSGGYCQISLKTDGSRLVQEIDRYRKTVTDQYQPYVWESDELSNSTGLVSDYNFQSCSTSYSSNGTSENKCEPREVR